MKGFFFDEVGNMDIALGAELAKIYKLTKIVQPDLILLPKS